MAEPLMPVNVAILTVPEATASTVYGMFDLFSSPGRDFQFITRGIAGEPRMHPYLVARDLAGFAAANGIWIKPHHDFTDAPRPDIVCIPDFFVNPGDPVAGLHAAEVAWLLKAHGEGALLASACSGAVLLGEAGFLADREATIHWGYTATLTNNFPGVRVRPHQSLVLSGEAHRIVMAGGGSSWQDLALFLIARYVGLVQAMEVAKVFMLQWHDMGQQPFTTLMPRGVSGDAVVDRCQDWVAEHFRLSAPVAAMAAVSGLPARTFMRRFRVAAGMTPLDYVHALRLEEAKQQLETGDAPVEAIANDVGYEDTSFFGRLFRRKVGLTPAQYRLRFGSLRRSLLG
jgi:transcriptional regulator GlxA family with amidase domain